MAQKPCTCTTLRKGRLVYKTTLQLSIEDFVFPYGSLDPDNRWIKMAALIPWDDVERNYRAGFVNNGAPAHPARMAFGTLIAKQVLDVSDEELVCQVAENPYLQYFIGLKEFSESCPFGASTLVAFRKRFTEDDICRINEIILGRASENANDKDNDDDPPGAGTLTLDATVAPSDITYPQDVKLLNCAREHLEVLIDSICAQTGSSKPRTYRQLARKDFLNWSKSKRRSAKKTRVAIGRQLGYIRRDLGYAQALTEELSELTGCQVALLETITVLYDQQRFMHQNHSHSVPNRIVSIAQPWVRPVVRGKANANTEFGAKLHISVDEGGYVRKEKLSFDVYNEAEGLIDAAESYLDRTGHYPSRILADQIYRNRSNLSWCKERGIRLSGPRLGRPPIDSEVTRQAKATARRDSADRNVVEAVFGTVKQAYGMDRVAARLEETTKTVICLAIMAFNLKKMLAASLSAFLEKLIIRLKRKVLGARDKLGSRSWNYQLVTE